MGTEFTELFNIVISFEQNLVTLQSRADGTMQKTFSNIEFYAADNFHSWGAPKTQNLAVAGKSRNTVHCNILNVKICGLVVLGTF